MTLTERPPEAPTKTTCGGTGQVADAMRVGFTDLYQEVEADCRVDGEIPEWLTGGLVRNGPARWTMATRRLNHWFDGAAMLHRFGIRGGKVDYRNRYLRSRNFRKIIQTGRNQYGQFSTDPKRSFWNKIISTLDFTLQFGNNDAITVTQIGTEWAAIGETPTQLAIDPDDLTTKGTFRFKDKLMSMWTCSHMVHDYARNRIYNYSVLAIPVFARYYMWHVDANTHRRTRIASIKEAKPAWMHSFGASEDHLIFTEFPYRLNTWGLFLGGITGTPFIRNYRWNKDEQTKTFVMHKETGKVVSRCTLPTMFSFHHVNAWEEDGDVVFDIAAYPDTSPIAKTYLDVLQGPEGGDFPHSGLDRYRLPLDGGAPVGPERVSDAPIEMPRFNPDYTSKPYRYVYGYSFDKPGQFYNKLVKIDTHGADPSTNYTWWGPDGYFPSEPVFVPKPGSDVEDEGVILAVVLDVSGDEPQSFMVILDAQTFDEIGRAYAPFAIPFGLHGEFVPGGAS